MKQHVKKSHLPVRKSSSDLKGALGSLLQAEEQEKLEPPASFKMQEEYKDLSETLFGRVVLASSVESWGPTPTYRNQIIGGVFSLVYLIEGSGIMERSDGFRTRLSPGDLFFTFPEFHHRYGGGTKHWLEYSIWFDGPAFDLLRSSGILSPDDPVIHLAPISFWQQKFRKITAPPHWPTQSAQLARCSELIQTLADAILHHDLECHGMENQRWLKNAFEVINTHYHEGHVCWQTIASQCNATPGVFRKKFSSMAGLSPKKYLTKIRMSHAAEMLQDPAKSISAISDELGFCDQFHFSKQFKKAMGVTPNSLRARANTRL